MADWQLHIDFSEFWNKYPDELTSKEICEKTVLVLKSERKDVLEKFLEFLDEFDEIIDQFEMLSSEDDVDIDEFDSILDDLYDWADTELDDNWNGKKLAWIKT